MMSFSLSLSLLYSQPCKKEKKRSVHNSSVPGAVHTSLSRFHVWISYRWISYIHVIVRLKSAAVQQYENNSAEICTLESGLLHVYETTDTFLTCTFVGSFCRPLIHIHPCLIANQPVSLLDSEWSGQWKQALTNCWITWCLLSHRRAVRAHLSMCYRNMNCLKLKVFTN